MDVIDTDLFLEMPMSAQLLYFHLSLRADDDGFIASTKRILRLIGCGDDDLKVLFSKRFVIPFESGVCVIRHWRIHNYIQSDRYHETIYKDEKLELTQDANGSYEKLDTECIQDVSKVLPEVRLGKASQGKTSKEEPKVSNEFFPIFWKAYPNKKAKGYAEKVWNKLAISQELLDTILTALEQHKQSKEWQAENGKYIPHPASWLNGRRWEDELEPEKTKVDGTDINIDAFKEWENL